MPTERSNRVRAKRMISGKEGAFSRRLGENIFQTRGFDLIKFIRVHVDRRATNCNGCGCPEKSRRNF